MQITIYTNEIDRVELNKYTLDTGRKFASLNIIFNVREGGGVNELYFHFDIDGDEKLTSNPLLDWFREYLQQQEQPHRIGDFCECYQRGCRDQRTANDAAKLFQAEEPQQELQQSDQSRKDFHDSFAEGFKIGYSTGLREAIQAVENQGRINQALREQPN